MTTDPKFFQGKPCRYGHDGLRYLKGKACVHCQRQRDKDNRQRHKQQPQVVTHETQARPASQAQDASVEKAATVI